jgi:hypothetical protein
VNLFFEPHTAPTLDGAASVPVFGIADQPLDGRELRFDIYGDVL